GARGGSSDLGWGPAAPQLRDGRPEGLPILTGGRSAGARVACRTAADTASVAVVCLAFPLHPPGRPEKSRLAELEGVQLATLVVQGEKDPFGIPPEGPSRTVTLIPGTHSLRSAAAVEAAVSAWLAHQAAIRSG